jgi:hypothetical protein
MECQEVEQRTADEVPLGPEGEAHVAGCEACRSLVAAGPALPRALGALASPPTLPVREPDVRAELAADRGIVSTVRSWSRPARMGIVAAIVALDALLAGTVLSRRDLDDYPRWRLFGLTVVHVAVLFVVMWEAMRPAYRPARSRGETAALLAFAVILPSAFLLLPELPTPVAFSYGRVGWFCFSMGVAQAVAVLILFGLVDRSAGQLRPFLLAAVAGGLLSQVGLTLHCPVNDRLHLFTGHALVPLGLLLGVLALGRRLR